MQILLIDNYDSFVFNLARYFERLGQATHVVRNDAIDVEGVRALRPAGIVLSPGPCTPREAGCSVDLVREFVGQVPMLGICLGHQAIAEALGGRVVRAAQPMHGRTSPIEHDGRGLFAGLPSPLRAARYHSLVVEEASLPGCLEISARSPDGQIMGVRHRRAAIEGVQFHPESVLTDDGYAMLAAFVRQCGLALPQAVPGIGDERNEPAPPVEVAYPNPGAMLTGRYGEEAAS